MVFMIFLLVFVGWLAHLTPADVVPLRKQEKTLSLGRDEK
jgi:hypothetical protein